MDNKIKALKVHQWLEEWQGIDFKDEERREPKKIFYMFSLSAKKLKLLSGIYRRELKVGQSRAKDKHIQRAHDQSRSENIREYIKYGYPWSELSGSQRKGQFDDLRKPGWLPTAVVVNILGKNDKRDGKSVAANDLIHIKDSEGMADIALPASFKGGEWKPEMGYPIEIIDGQHRLLAFDDHINQDDYELPVVAFHELALGWQAYLFWTINIKPKRINPSLAFDLYPLLRTQDWLDRFEGHKVYREARAQEITEALWAEPESSWHNRINMLGGSGSVTQAAWVRALLKSYIKSYEGPGVSIGGLFGARIGQDKTVLPWKRQQQAAFLILLWNEIRDAIQASKEEWCMKLRSITYKNKIIGDTAFVGSHSLFNDDQGISVVLNVTNDIFYTKADSLSLKSWDLRDEYGLDSDVDVKMAFKHLKKQKKIVSFVKELAEMLSTFDWRSSGTPNLSDYDKTVKLSYRGGSGYREFRKQLLKHLFKQENEIGQAAKLVYSKLGFNKK